MKERTRVPLNISFLNQQDKQDALDKAKERMTTVSALVQRYFKKLPHIEQ